MVSFRNGFVVVYFRTWRKPEVFLRAVNTRFNAFGIMFWLICWAFSLFVWCVHLSRHVASLCAGLFYILVSAILHNETSPMFSFGGDTLSLRFATLISGLLLRYTLRAFFLELKVRIAHLRVIIAKRTLCFKLLDTNGV